VSDPYSVDELAKVAGPVVLGSGGVAALMRWFAGKEAQALSTQIALMSAKIDALVISSAKHDTIGERVALLEQECAAIRRELSALVAPTPIERRKR